MCSVHDHSRMMAIAAVSRVAENEALSSLQSQDTSETLTLAPWKRRKVSSDLVKGLEDMLEDGVVHVRVPSAVTLYSMDKQTEMVWIM